MRDEGVEIAMHAAPTAVTKNADGTPLFPLVMDPKLFAFALLLATVTGLLAAFAPARSAARLDPVVAIRG